MMHYSKDNRSSIDYTTETESIGDKGLGSLLVLLQVLQAVDAGELLLTDQVKVNEVIAKEKRSPNAVQFDQGESISLSELIRLHICTMGPDTSLLLAKLFREQTKKSCQKAIDAFVAENELTETCCKNISGRKKRNDPQSYTIHDVKKISAAFMRLSKELLAYFIDVECVHKGKLFKKQGHLVGEREVGYRISWLNNSIVFDDQTLVVVLEAENAFELDQQLLKLWFDETEETISIEKLVKENKKQKTFRKKNVTMTVVGDTYLGEWYSERRIKRNQWDPLTEEGYDYSFEKVQPFLDEADFTIANLEAVLVDNPTVSPMKRKKKFVLGAKADITAETFKKHGIDLVTLATNHTNDFGCAGILSTLAALKKQKIAAIGSGHTSLEALCPYRLKTKSQDLFVFNGYWFRNGQYNEFGMYAQGDHLGGNCLSQQLFRTIQRTKEEFPASKVIVLCHWGIDFQQINPTQRVIAKRLVDAGADLIMGHGPHAIQPIEQVEGVDVLYSLGNFVFNSNGEFDTHPEALPYGMVTQLKLEDDQMILQAQMIYAENHLTRWQPRKVDIADFNRILDTWGEANLQEIGWQINRENGTLTKQVW